MTVELLRALVTGATPPARVSERDLAATVEHRLHGLAHAALERGDLDLAAPQRTQLRATMLVERTHRARIQSTVEQSAAAADHLGVNVAVFKGVAVEKQWYAGPLERPCSDLDLLLSPDDFSCADQLVEALQPGHPLSGSIGRLFASHRLQSVDVRVDGGASIDLHADLFKIEIPMRSAFSVFAAELPIIDLDGCRMPTVDCEVALVQLLLHLNKDRFAYLLNVADVLRIVDGGAVDWDRVAAIAHAEGVESHVFGALRRVMDWSRRDMPEAVRQHGSLVWRGIWPARLVGQGGSGIAIRRRRQLLIPLTARGRSVEAVRSLWRRWVRVDPAVRQALERPSGD